MHLLQIQQDGKEFRHEGSPVDLAEKLTKLLEADQRRYMFTLAEGGMWPGMQFRVWHAPFGHTYDGHFDSCGTGMSFHLNGSRLEMDGFLVAFKPVLGGMKRWTTQGDRTIIALWVGW